MPKMRWKPNWGPVVDPVAKRRAWKKVKTQLKEIMLTGEYNVEWSKLPDTDVIARIVHRKYRERYCRIVLGKDDQPSLRLCHLRANPNVDVRDITPIDTEAFGSTIMDWLDKSRPINLE